MLKFIIGTSKLLMIISITGTNKVFNRSLF